MRVALPYAHGTIEAELPADTRRLSSEAEGTLAPLGDLGAALRAALAAPLGLPCLGQLVRPGGRVTIAFDDHTVDGSAVVRSMSSSTWRKAPLHSMGSLPVRALAPLCRLRPHHAAHGAALLNSRLTSR